MKSQTCYNCDEEFIVENLQESNCPVIYCPYCGSDLEDLSEDEDIEEDEDYRD